MRRSDLSNVWSESSLDWKMIEIWVNFESKGDMAKGQDNLEKY